MSDKSEGKRRKRNTPLLEYCVVSEGMVELVGADHTQSDDTREEREKRGVFGSVRVGVIVIQSLCDDSKFVFNDDVTQTKNVVESSKDDFDHGIVSRHLARRTDRLIVDRSIIVVN